VEAGEAIEASGRRFGWLFPGLLAGLVMSVLAFSPLAWNLSGRGESYPELVYFGLGLPTALIAILAGALLAWLAPKAKPQGWPYRALKVTAVAAITVCALLVLMMVPVIPLGTGVLSALFYVVLPVLIMALLVAGVSAFLEARRR
jgi:peptidoglycan/LPS O-acetylase OafA/YrhL